MSKENDFRVELKALLKKHNATVCVKLDFYCGGDNIEGFDFDLKGVSLGNFLACGKEFNYEDIKTEE